MNKNFKINFSI
jgi:Flp pilus assembly protein TadD